MKLSLTLESRAMIRRAVMTRPNMEVMGFGRVEKRDGDLWVTDIIIPPHEVHSASVELKPEVLTALMLELSDSKMMLCDWPLWWHSHGTMSVGPSSTDTETLKALAREFGGAALGMVTNCNEEYYGWFVTYTEAPIIGEIVSDGKLDILVEEVPISKKLAERVDNMMSYVTTPPPVIRRRKWNPVSNLFEDLTDDDSKLTKKERKAHQRRMSISDIVPLYGKAYYMYEQAKYAPSTPQAKMSLEEFSKWYDDSTAALCEFDFGFGI